MSAFRIERGVVAEERTALHARTAFRKKYTVPPDEFGARLTKLIPADVVGLYLAGRGIAASSDVSVIWIVLCLCIVVLARALLTRDKSRRVWFSGTQWDVVAYSAISFLIWVYAIGGTPSLPYVNYFSGIGQLMALAWPVTASYLVLLPGNRAAVATRGTSKN
jgi:hypothetical protein